MGSSTSHNPRGFHGLLRGKHWKELTEPAFLCMLEATDGVTVRSCKLRKIQFRYPFLCRMSAMLWLQDVTGHIARTLSLILEIWVILRVFVVFLRSFTQITKIIHLCLYYEIYIGGISYKIR
jgi:uncharacterized membrane protein YcfT